MAQDLTSRLKSDIETYFHQKHGPVSIHWNDIHPQGDEMAKVDFRVSNDHEVIGHYIGMAGYIDDKLSLDHCLNIII